MSTSCSSGILPWVCHNATELQGWGGIAGAVGIIIVIAQLYWLRKQVRDTNTWNRQKAVFEFFQLAEIKKKCEAVKEHEERLGISPDSPISLEDAKRLFADRSAAEAINQYLGDLERAAVAVTSNLMDEKLAYNLSSGDMILCANRYETYISELRRIRDDPEYYECIELIAPRWETEFERRKSGRASRYRIVPPWRHTFNGLRETLWDPRY